MTVLNDYRAFAGLHWETGTICNVFAAQGITAPHTAQPYSEALLLGISGGIVMGYFSFAYEGYDPHARILTRYPFDAFETVLARLGVVQDVRQTTNAAKAVRNLLEALAEGMPAIVWADMFSLPYNALPYDEGMWGMMPIVVYGYDEAADQVWIADRARVPLTSTTAELAAARGRIKKDKFRLLTLDQPDPDKVPAAVQAGIWDCLKLFTEQPPKGARHNWGLAAFRWWAELLTKPKARMSWAKEFPPVDKLYAGLTSAFTDINTFGKQGNAERRVYADFLDEASVILNRPGLRSVAEQFRQSAERWDELSRLLLPDSVPGFGETRRLLLRRHEQFLDHGNTALAEIYQIDERLAACRAELVQNFPLDAAGVADFQQTIADQLLRLHDGEEQAVAELRATMA